MGRRQHWVVWFERTHPNGVVVRREFAIRYYLVRALAVIVVVMGLPVVGIVVAQRASAAPYGGCDEAWQAPHSAGATWCRRHGWYVSRRLVVDRHSVVRYSRLPHCPWEDGGENQPCSWNFGSGDGNGLGLQYWIDRNDRTHYVWFRSPARSPWHWVSSEMSDVLAEGWYPHAWARDWQRCVTRDIRGGFVVRCPNGDRYSQTTTSY